MTTFWGVPVVYRCFAANGRLLYVGSSQSVESRFMTHRSTSWWWPQVARTSIRIAPDATSAREWERSAIRAERPRWNVQGIQPRTLLEVIDLITAINANGTAYTSYNRRHLARLQRQAEALGLSA